MATIHDRAPRPIETTTRLPDRLPGVPPFRAQFPGGNRPRSRPRAEAATPEQQRLFRVLVTGLFFGYMVAAVLIYLWREVWFTPDKWAMFLLVGAFVLGRVGPFLRDWIPFVLLVFGYEYLRGVAGTLVTDGQRIHELPREEVPNVYLEGLIRFDLAMFNGHNPVQVLQDWLYVPGTIHWYDYLAVVVYAMHFVLPCLFAFTLWLTHKSRFWQFTLTLCFMTYVAFIFFLWYPAAPPWMAEIWGVTDGLHFPQNAVLRSMSGGGLPALDTRSIWGNASPHPAAAMPSLHAGFPWLVMLFGVKFFRWKGLVFLPYNIALWFSVVYTANHWVVDLVAGIAWATLSFALIDYVWIELTERGGIPWPEPLRRAGMVAYAMVIAPLLPLIQPIWDAPGKARRALFRTIRG